MEVETAAAETSTGIDIESASDSIGASMFPDAPSDVAVDVPDTQEGQIAALPDASTPTTQAPEVAVADHAPKSWPKEMHDHWGKTPKEVQQYWQTREKQMLDGLEQYKGAATYGKAINEVLAPYHQILQSKGLDAPRAVADLMQAYVGLTQGTPEQRHAAYLQIGKNLGIQAPQVGEQPVQVDPNVKALQDQFGQIQSALMAQQQAAFDAAKGKAMQEVEAFASDTKAHPYYAEVETDMLQLMQSGVVSTLQDAYDLAVKKNGATYSKEIARIQTEHEAKLKENARLASLPKKQAKSVNIGGRETHRAPTEPLGSMEDEMKKTLTEIRSRVAH